MGVCRVRARRGRFRPEESADARRPDRVRRAGYARLRKLVEDAGSGSAGATRSGRRSVLEAGMTAGEVMERIRKNLGAPWRESTYRDTFKHGGPETTVTGIATTGFVTLSVIRKAAAAGLNMIIPHEVTFWNDRDDVSPVSTDPLYQIKLDLLR